MKKVFSILMVAFTLTAMVACEVDPTNPATPGGDTPGGENPGGGTTVQTDTTLMNYTLMRSLVDIDWDEACSRVMAMGFTRFEDDEEDNVRAFMKGSPMGDYYACYLRCDNPDGSNLVGGVVMHEHHMGSSSQAVCVENLIRFANDERRVLSDMSINSEDCGGIITWNELTGTSDPSYYHGYAAFDGFATALRALEVHASVNANWADNYTYNNSMYVATSSAVCTSNDYVSIVENIIALAKEDNLD